MVVVKIESYKSLNLFLRSKHANWNQSNADPTIIIHPPSGKKKVVTHIFSIA